MTKVLKYHQSNTYTKEQVLREPKRVFEKEDRKQGKILEGVERKTNK